MRAAKELDNLRLETIARRIEMAERRVGDKVGEVMSFYMIKDLNGSKKKDGGKGKLCSTANQS